MEIKEYRNKIDSIDSEMLRLFRERMQISAEIGKYKKENNIPVFDGERERKKLGEVAAAAGEDFAAYAETLYNGIFDISRSYQRRLFGNENPIKIQIQEALKNTPDIFPERPLIACQGREGAYSQKAGEKLFKAPQIMFFDSFEGVFSAVDKGLCRYGILPLENSTAGSVNRIYDLMLKYNFKIVRSTRLKINHSLLANRGSSLSDIREIFSHPQAIAQCEDFLSGLSDVKVTPCTNTAEAARMVFESGRKDAASVSSQSCAELYNLDCLRTSVQDHGSNFTRFICISKNPEIYPGADKTSIMMILPHTRGSLYKVLAVFNTLGLNLMKLESRPLPDSDFEFMFYFDLDASVYSPEFLSLFDDIEGITVDFKYLGSYSEVV